MRLVFMAENFQEKNGMSIHISVSCRTAMRVALVALLILMTAPSAPVLSRPQDDAQAAEKVKAKVAKLGTGKRSRVEVSTKDDRRLKGYVGEISENSFTIVDPKRGTVKTISYYEVDEVRSRNHDGRHLAFAGAAMVGAIILALALATSSR
jgi:uncharacterized protein (DUF1684 family)